MDFKKDDLFDNTISITKKFKSNKFITFIKNSIIHYCEMLERVKPFPKNDERAFFIEAAPMKIVYC